MGYIQSKQHFANLLRKMRDNDWDGDPVDESMLLSIDDYWAALDVHMVDSFTWALRSDKTLLHADRFNMWNAQNCVANSAWPVDSRATVGMDARCVEIVRGLVAVSGVYCFWGIAGESVYIGKSTNLGNRIAGSFSERRKQYTGRMFLSYILAEPCEIGVIEQHLIAIRKPLLNSEGKYSGRYSLVLDGVPEMSDRVLLTAECD